MTSFVAIAQESVNGSSLSRAAIASAKEFHFTNDSCRYAGKFRESLVRPTDS